MKPPATSLPVATGNWLAYLAATVICAIVTLIAGTLSDFVDLTNIAMLFLLAVVVVAVSLGRGPALAAAFMAVAAFDFFFVPPRYTFAVSDAKYVLTFIVMFIVALIVGQLMARFRQNAAIAARGEARAIALYELARELSAAMLLEQVRHACLRFLSAELDAQAALMVLDRHDCLQIAHGEGESAIGFDPGNAHSVFISGQPDRTDARLLYLPLKAPMRTRGIIIIKPKDSENFRRPEAQRLLDTFANLVAIALERLHYVDIAQDTTVQVETERLRNSLLATISHDLRTPLSALVGLAESMALTKPPPSGTQAAVAQSIIDISRRISAQVNNLLEMARLQSGKVQLNRQWQPVEEVIGSALESNKIALVSRTIRIDIPEDMPLVEFDSVLIERLLANLLENAAKYTPEKSPVRIAANVAGNRAEIRVEDAGPGLPKHRTDALFEKFERGEREGATTGVGLGLAICQAIATAHGGSLYVARSSLGGACFVLSLPLGEPPSMPTDESMAAPQP